MDDPTLNNSNDTQLTNVNLNAVPFHIHNGADSPQINPKYLLGFPQVSVSNALISPTDTPLDGTIRFLYDTTHYVQWVRINGLWKGVLVFSTPTNSYTLLHAASGTTGNTAANNLDTIAISGLTALDTLLVYVDVSYLGTQGFLVKLYNSTDSLVLVNSGWQANGNKHVQTGSAVLQQDGQSVNYVNCINDYISGGSGVLGSNTGGQITKDYYNSLFTTSWQGSWTLALRDTTGVFTGETGYWSWKVYKISGQ